MTLEECEIYENSFKDGSKNKANRRRSHISHCLYRRMKKVRGLYKECALLPTLQNLQITDLWKVDACSHMHKWNYSRCIRSVRLHDFYVLLTVHPCIISQIDPTRCTILFNIFVYFSSVHVPGIHVPIIRRKLLYLCDTGICHSVWVASGLSYSIYSNEIIAFFRARAKKCDYFITVNTVW